MNDFEPYKTYISYSSIGDNYLFMILKIGEVQKVMFITKKITIYKRTTFDAFFDYFTMHGETYEQLR